MKKKLFPLLLIVACAAAELILSNYMAIYFKLGGIKEYPLDLSSAEFSVEKNGVGTYDTAYREIELYKASAVFKNINTPMKNIKIKNSGGLFRYYDIQIKYTDDNYALNNNFNNNLATLQIYTEDKNEQWFNISSYGEIKELEILAKTDTGVRESIYLSEVTINSVPKFSFSIARFILILAVVFIIYTKAWRIKLNRSNYNILIKNTALICVMLCFMTVLLAQSPDRRLLEEYPLKYTHYTADEYRELFYAFQDGRVNIKVYSNLNEAKGIDDVYDKSQRIFAESEGRLHGETWDRAYYNGNFYVYFGVMPIFTVYYPVYFVTLGNYIPTITLSCVILALYYVLAVSALYILVLKRFCRGAPLVLAVIGQHALIMGSAVLALACDFRMYSLAVISGITFVCLFFYFILKAYFANSHKRKIIWLIFTGLSVPIIVASRPTLLLYCFAGLIPAAYVLRSKNESLKHKIVYLLSAGVPVIAGAVMIMIYNYVRFDNPFEFGFNYQLTVSKAQANNITLALIPAALYHYFFQQPKVSASFPYIKLRSPGLGYYPRYVYTEVTVGIFNYPYTWFAFLMPCVGAKGEKAKFRNRFFGAIFATALFLAFFNMCKAGAHYRYTVDILTTIMLIGTVVMYDLMGKMKKYSSRIWGFMFVFAVLALSMTAVMGYLMIFANETGYFLHETGKLLDALRNM